MSPWKGSWNTGENVAHKNKNGSQPFKLRTVFKGYFQLEIMPGAATQRSHSGSVMPIQASLIGATLHKKSPQLLAADFFAY